VPKAPRRSIHRACQPQLRSACYPASLRNGISPSIKSNTIVGPEFPIALRLSELYNGNTQTTFPKLARINLDCRSYTGNLIDYIAQICGPMTEKFDRVGI
jgi:hypothetical protein